jgi:hypothetical protein
MHVDARRLAAVSGSPARSRSSGRARCLLPGFASAAGTAGAVVSARGALVRGNGAAGARHLATRRYEVDFTANVRNCAYVATPGDTGSGSVAGSVYATTAQRRGGVFVEVVDRVTNADVDDPFHLSVFCGTGRLWGVISATGSKVRGPNVVSSQLFAGFPGAYEVIFDKDVHACALTAGLGATAGGVSARGTITVAVRATTNDGVFVQIEGNDGQGLNASFHVEVDCAKAEWWGVISAGGTTVYKLKSRNELGSAKLAPPTPNDGRYEVDFNRDVSDCIYIATVGEPGVSGDITTPVTTSTGTLPGNPEAVFVFHPRRRRQHDRRAVQPRRRVLLSVA